MGFETGKFVPEVEKDKQCLLCHLVLDNPIKTPCGHLFCSGCILPWVVKHEKCPLSCQIIKTSDLENELHLRELILNSTVRCEYRNRGCPKIVRLLDLETHTKLCEFRPVKCPNLGCLALVCFRELEKHRTSDCNFHNAVVCGNGCGLPLLPDLLETHQCVPTLRSQIAVYENHINAMECEMTKMSLQFNKRENYFLHQFASLHRELRLQTLYFRKRMVQCQNTELQKCSEPNLVS
jgi:ligand of Numb protein X 3/4